MAWTDVTTRAAFEAMIAPFLTPSQASMVNLAYRLSKYGHQGQRRDDGSRYFDHPRAVTTILLEVGITDEDVLVAGLLHDVVEDSFIVTFDDLAHIFGERASVLIRLVTKERGLSVQAYYARLAAGPSEAIVVKLADRLHNMDTLHLCTREKQFRKLAETRALVLPLCDRLAGDQRYEATASYLRQCLEERCASFDRSLSA